MKFSKTKAMLPLILGVCSSVVLAAEQAPLEPRSQSSKYQQEHGLEHVHKTVTNKTVTNNHQKPKISSSVSKSSNQLSAVAAACDLTQFTSNNTQTLINAIEVQGIDCINLLFNTDSTTQSQTYTSTKMIAAANHVNGLAQSYAGGGNEDIQSFFLFLRAGFFVEFYNDNVTFSASVTPSVKGSIDQFVDNQHFYDDNDAHGKTLGEVMITMDSAELQHEYLGVVKEWLSRWNESYASKWYMRSAVNNAFTLLYRGQWNPEFVTAVSSDTELVSDLSDFTMKSWMLDSDAAFMINNAAAELGRLKLYNGAPIQSNVDTALNKVFSTYESYGYGDGVWLSAANNATYYANCSDYGICGFEEEVEAKALSQTHSCSSTIKIRSQNMNNAQYQSACSTLELEEDRFHSMLETNNQSVEDDYNNFLQVNIFDSDSDYKKYAGVIFGISTDNGGMYLEGDPSVQGNQANFVAFEASYAKPDHYVWNLEHEYVHYLDGRFNLYGGFNAPTEAIVWWSEGVAEYIANLNDNQAAIDTINDGSTYTLAQVFDTTYSNGDSDRIYRWGYLAVRFMFERHPDEVQTLRAATRVGNWSQYKSTVDSWVSNYSSEFTQWTQQLANQDPQNDSPVSVINGPYSGIEGQAIQFSSAGSYDPDGNIASYAWSFGDGSSSSSASPSHTYSSAGQYTATLTVTDDKGATTSDSTTVSVSSTSPSNELINGQSITINGAQDSESVYQLEVTQGATELSFVLNGGTGDADLYVRYGAEPTQNSYDCRPYIGGNNETCDISNAQAGTYYVMVVGYNAYANVTLTGAYTEASSNVPDACQSQSAVSGGRLNDGQAECLSEQDPMWFSLENVSGHNSVAITTGNGGGNLTLEYSNSGWPTANNVDVISDNSGNNECIYLTNQSQYWGYLKISGQVNGASIVVDYDAQGCR